MRRVSGGTDTNTKSVHLRRFAPVRQIQLENDCNEIHCSNNRKSQLKVSPCWDTVGGAVGGCVAPGVSRSLWTERGSGD